MKRMAYFLRSGVWAFCSVLFLVIVALSFLTLYLANQLPNVDSLKTVKLQVPLHVYTQEGLLIQEYGEKKRIPLSYDQIPQTLIHALLATEDQRFFEHPGVDILGLGRATLRMLKTGTKSQGGSTITMQVARNFFLTRKKTFLRKFNEILLAIKIDRELSKEKILELYLNKIYLGSRAYGVGAAAEIYYGKPLNTLNLAQLAMIAGLPQAPSTQNPIVNPKAAKKRRDHVLERLLEEQFITQKDFDEAIKEPITATYHGTHIDVNAPYVAEMIRQTLYEHYGDKAYTNGYKVYTTLQGNLQNAANTAVASHLIAYDKRHGYRGAVARIPLPLPAGSLLKKQLAAYSVAPPLLPAVILQVSAKQATALLYQGDTITLPWTALASVRPALQNGWMGKAPTHAGQVVHPSDVVYVHQDGTQWKLGQLPEVQAALVALNPQNGAIKALVGGFNFEKNKFNHVTQSNRQPGSSFKPFLYAAALDKNYTLATLINDGPIVVDDPSQPIVWRPHNDTRTFNGLMRLKEALARSRNLVSIRILDDLGFDYVIEFLTRFGFQKNQLPRGLSLALGSLTVSPLDLTRAYAVFANGGFSVEPYLIDKITDNDGKLLLQTHPLSACESCTAPTATSAPRVIPADTAFLMTIALREVVQHGTAHAAMVLHRNDLAGKTGTTNNQMDAWFSGYNATLAVSTWFGFDTPQSLHEYGAGLALPLWIDFMKTALQGVPEIPLQQPDNIVAVRIDPVTGLLAGANQTNAIIEYFREKDVPQSDESSSPVAPANINAPTQDNLF